MLVCLFVLILNGSRKNGDKLSKKNWGVLCLLVCLITKKRVFAFQRK